MKYRLRRIDPWSPFATLVGRQGGSVMRLLLVVILILLLLGSLPAWPYSAGWGYYPSGGLGLVLLIVILVVLLDRRRARL